MQIRVQELEEKENNNEQQQHCSSTYGTNPSTFVHYVGGQSYAQVVA